MIKWLHQHKFAAHLTIFILMIFSSIGLCLAIYGDAPGLIGALLSAFVGANLVAVFVM